MEVKLSIGFSILLTAINCLPNPEDTFDTTFGCHQCIRNGHAFITTQDWYEKLESGVATSGVCCELPLSADCSVYDAAEANLVQTGNKISTDDFSSPDLALTGCPQKKDVCGSQFQFDFEDTSATEEEISMSSFTDKDSCTYLIKAECGAPGFWIDTTG